MRNIIVEEMDGIPASKHEVELVERKGLGHPDSLADGIAEAVSCALCRYYLDKFGVILHHNTDKGEVCGGATKPVFGGGEIIKPIFVLLSGQATDKTESETIPVSKIAIKAAKDYIKSTLPLLDVDDGVLFDSKINMGSADLRDVFGRKGVPAANDTSIGIGFAPMTELEKIVLDTERFLNSPEYKKKRPEVGQDIKIMGARAGGKIKLTIAAAMISHLINDMRSYVELKETVTEDLRRFILNLTNKEVEIFLNAADSPEKGGNGCYLTVTGTSAEMGDSGAVGRGNRVNGLITFNRPMSMEATCGKNPVNHVGKLYNLLAFKTAERVFNKVPGIKEIRIRLLSQIGRPIDQPMVASAEVVADDFKSIKSQVAKVMDDEIAKVTDLTDQIINNKISVF